MAKSNIGPPGGDVASTWEEYSQLVLNELRRLNKEIGSINDKLDRVHVDVAVLKAKAALWGFAAGAVPGLVIAFWKYSQ